MNKNLIQYLIAILLSVVVVSNVSADVITDWNLITITATKKAGQNSNYATRTAAIEAIAVYDAVNSVKQFGVQYFYFAPVKIQSSAEAAAVSAAYNVLIFYFPAQKEFLAAAFKSSIEHISDGQVGAAIETGAAAADAIIQKRANDGWNRVTNFEAAQTLLAGQYRATPKNFAPGIDPHWGNVQPFLLSSTKQFFPPPPPALNTDDYKKALEEVKLLGATNSSIRTSDQAHISQFWKQDAELGVNEAARQLSTRHKTSLEENALIFLLVDIAAADARIEVWAAKYHYLSWRPVTALNAAEDGQVKNNYSDWTPLISTPPHPSYPSGHSATVTAGFEILKHFFGNKDQLELHSTTAGDTTRTIHSLTEGESENGLSRIYGGIHFNYENSNGQQVGKDIAVYIIQNGPHFNESKK